MLWPYKAHSRLSAKRDRNAFGRFKVKTASAVLQLPMHDCAMMPRDSSGACLQSSINQRPPAAEPRSGPNASGNSTPPQHRGQRLPMTKAAPFLVVARDCTVPSSPVPAVVPSPTNGPCRRRDRDRGGKLENRGRLGGQSAFGDQHFAFRNPSGG